MSARGSCSSSFTLLMGEYGALSVKSTVSTRFSDVPMNSISGPSSVLARVKGARSKQSWSRGSLTSSTSTRSSHPSVTVEMVAATLGSTIPQSTWQTVAGQTIESSRSNMLSTKEVISSTLWSGQMTETSSRSCGNMSPRESLLRARVPLEQKTITFQYASFWN